MRHGLYPVDALKRRATEWSVRLRVTPRVIRVQPMRRKWGSCSLQGTVTLATDLVDEDPRFQDYVIVHELLHLRVRNHGRLFKVLMTAYVPGWRQISQRHADSQRHTGSASARTGRRNARRARRSPQDAGTTSRESLRSGFNRRR